MTDPFLHPAPEASTIEFWDGCRSGSLLVKRCRGCGRAHFYPRSHCPFCWSDDVAWEEASGRGTLYTWSVVHQNELPPFRDLVPYVPALVDLDEGPRMMTRIVEADPASLVADMAVEVRFVSGSEGITVPFFAPSDSGPEA